MATKNLENTTREMWDRTVEKEVWNKLALLALLNEVKRLKVSGRKLQWTSVTADLASLMQDFAGEEEMTVGSKTVTAKSSVKWKKCQLPIWITEEEMLENTEDKDTSPVKLATLLVERGQEGARVGLQERFFANRYGATSEDGKPFQGIIAALKHGSLYAGRDRSQAAEVTFQSASINNAYTDQADPISPSIANFRKAKAAVSRQRQGPAKRVVLVGEALFQTFQTQVESRHIYTRDGSMLAKYGFDTFMIDNTEFVSEPYLTLAGRETEFFLLTPDTWEFRLHPKRAFLMTPLKWQGDQVKGVDAWLSRLMLKGNLVCKKPNQNLWRSNMA